MKGVFPLLGPKALVRTKQTTISFFFSCIRCFVFLEGRCDWHIGPDLCVATLHPGIDPVQCFFFSPLPLVYTDLSKVEMENPFKDPKTALSGQEGCNTEMESADCMPNATRLFLRIENKINRYINCSHILKWQVLMSSLTIFSFFLFIILFLGLSWGFCYNFTLLNISS